MCVAVVRPPAGAAGGTRGGPRGGARVHRHKMTHAVRQAVCNKRKAREWKKRGGAMHTGDGTAHTHPQTSHPCRRRKSLAGTGEGTSAATTVVVMMMTT